MGYNKNRKDMFLVNKKITLLSIILIGLVGSPYYVEAEKKLWGNIVIFNSLVNMNL